MAPMDGDTLGYILLARDRNKGCVTSDKVEIESKDRREKVNGTGRGRQ